MAEEQRYVLGVAYPAGPAASIQRGADGGRDFISAENLETAAWEFMRSGRQIGVQHADGTVGAADPVESFLWRWGPLEIDGEVVVDDGDWMLGAILDEPSWNAYKAGEITGWSPQGHARRIRPGGDR